MTLIMATQAQQQTQINEMKADLEFVSGLAAILVGAWVANVLLRLLARDG